MRRLQFLLFNMHMASNRDECWRLSSGICCRVPDIKTATICASIEHHCSLCPKAELDHIWVM